MNTLKHPDAAKHNEDLTGDRRHSHGSILSAHRKRKPLSTMQSHIIAAIAEFVGIFMFLFLAYAGHLMAVSQASTRAPNGLMDNQTVVIIGLAYAISLLVNVWAFYRISGGLFNPAVTLGLCMAGALPWFRGLVLFPAQLLGGIVAAALVSCMFPGDIAKVNTRLSLGTTIAQGLFIEMFLTCELVLTVLMLAAEKSKDTFIAPIGIGLALFIAETAGVFYTGGSLNPARSLGPAVVSSSFSTYHWIYWVGPMLGASISTGYYRFAKAMNYEEANPNQDSAA